MANIRDFAVTLSQLNILYDVFLEHTKTFNDQETKNKIISFSVFNMQRNYETWGRVSLTVEEAFKSKNGIIYIRNVLFLLHM